MVGCRFGKDTNSTFTQTAPLDRFYGVSGTVHSVDLKAARDRWLLILLFALMQALFSACIVNSTLATNVFNLSFISLQKSVSFVDGQLLGYYHGSYSYCHIICLYGMQQHFYTLVSYLFYKDAVLGNDVVIADDRVKDAYSTLLSRLGVSISVQKSLPFMVVVSLFRN